MWFFSSSIKYFTGLVSPWTVFIIQYMHTVCYIGAQHCAQILQTLASWRASCHVQLLIHLEETGAHGLWLVIPILILTKFSFQSYCAHFSDLKR